MDSTWTGVLWRQLGAAIDMLDNAVVACPDALWDRRVWDPPADADLPLGFAEVWYIAFHALFWLDLYLSGASEEGFAPPAPFTRPPQRRHTKEEVRLYLAHARQKCRAILGGLTDEQARRVVEYDWTEGQPVSFLELQFVNLRHVQEHAAQLSLFLGQHGVPDEALDWVARTGGELGGP